MTMIRELLNRSPLILLSRIALGGLFIYASLDKIVHPLAFAQVIHHYRLAPPEMINLIAVGLPWIELIAGLLLIVGYRARGANVLIGAMLVFFILVLSITAARGINVSCGCFSTSTAVKSNLILRIIEDIGMLLLTLHIFFFYKKVIVKEMPVAG
jgi:uncharacterized membrane protein YphA (DoxX/SURF4 family)